MEEIIQCFHRQPFIYLGINVLKENDFLVQELLLLQPLSSGKFHVNVLES